VAKTKKLVAKFGVTAANRTDTEQKFYRNCGNLGCEWEESVVSSFL